MRRTRRSAASALGMLAAVALLGSLAPSAFAVPADPVPGPTQHVVFMLAPTNAAKASWLGRQHNLSFSLRRKALAAITPSATTRAAVIAEINASGMHVDNVTDWSISASSPRTTLVNQLHVSSSHRGWLFPGNARQSSPLWARLGSSVQTIAAFAPNGGPKRHPLAPAPQTGTDLQTLYDAKLNFNKNDPTQLSDLTVATLQFSYWDKSALTTFAQSSTLQGGLGWKASGPGSADPTADGQYQEVMVDGGALSDPTNANSAQDYSGDIEVALDQESLLAAAPTINQRAYFAPNIDSGEIDALNKIAADANPITGTGDHIVALSISWGLCEAEMDPGTQASMHAAFDTLTREGVTVFAASGDDGSKDCARVLQANGMPSVHANENVVDNPANDPLVVGVGGTTVDNQAGAQTAWGNSGGGQSQTQYNGFALPAYQANVAPAGTTGRLVPDIATDADPNSGFQLFCNQPCTAGTQGWNTVGGTSLASPVAAATLANELAIQGRTSGVGDIHQLLYDATSAQVHDITSGDSNGAYSPKVGYDNVTGLGYPDWNNLFPPVDAPPVLNAAPYTNKTTIALGITINPGAKPAAWSAGVKEIGGEPTDCSAVTSPTKPTSVSVPLDGDYTVWVAEKATDGGCNIVDAKVTVDRVAPTETLFARFASAVNSHYAVSWVTKDDKSPQSTKVTYTQSGSSKVTVLVPTTANEYYGNRTGSGTPGVTYHFASVGYDAAGNTSTPAMATLTVPFDDANFALKGWTKIKSSSAYFGTFSKSTSASATATKAIKATSYSVQYTACPTCGMLGVYVNGKLTKSINTHAAAIHWHATALVLKGALKSRTITVRPLGPKTVEFDGFVAVS